MSFIERIPAWVWIAIIAHFAVLGTVAYLILLERKIASWVQDRIGPNRVGPLGLLQPIADGLKFILKEDYRPSGVDRKLFTLAPALMIAVIISPACGWILDALKGWSHTLALPGVGDVVLGPYRMVNLMLGLCYGLAWFGLNRVEHAMRKHGGPHNYQAPL